MGRNQFQRINAIMDQLKNLESAVMAEKLDMSDEVVEMLDDVDEKINEAWYGLHQTKHQIRKEHQEST